MVFVCVGGSWGGKTAIHKRLTGTEVLDEPCLTQSDEEELPDLEVILLLSLSGL